MLGLIIVWDFQNKKWMQSYTKCQKYKLEFSRFTIYDKRKSKINEFFPLDFFNLKTNNSYKL
jgi:hypothetical protein